MKEQELSNSIKEHGLTWYQQCKVSMLCGTVHPPLLWVSATTVWEHLWTHMENLNSFNYNLAQVPDTIFGEIPVKTSFSHPSPHAACNEPFWSLCCSLCSAAAPRARLAAGWKLVFSQFPTLTPKQFCWHAARESARIKSWGTAALLPNMKHQTEKQDIYHLPS